MSGGAVAVAPALVVAPVIAAAAAVVVGAGLAAALVIKGAQAGTAATGRALERFGDEVEKSARKQDDRAVRARLWDLAACATVEANQNLRLLTARAEKAGVRVSLPASYDLAGQDLTQVAAWTTRARHELAAARAAIERAEAAREKQVLLRRLPAPPGGSPTAAELLDRYQEVLVRRRPQPATPVALSPKLDPDQLHAETTRILERLDRDTTPAERETAILAAARVEKQTQVGASRTYLAALTRIVDQEINPKVARRREAAGLLAALEQQPVQEAITEADPVPPCLSSIERLRAAVSGDADVTPADLRAGQEALFWAQQQMDRRRLMEVVAETFSGLGYTVSTGMSISHSAALSVARDNWNGTHVADVWVDEQGNLQSRLVELTPGAPSEVSRCEDLNASTRQVGETLERRGYDATAHIPEQLIKPVRRHNGGGSRADKTSTVEATPLARARDAREER